MERGQPCRLWQKEMVSNEWDSCERVKELKGWSHVSVYVFLQWFTHWSVVLLRGFLRGNRCINDSNSSPVQLCVWVVLNQSRLIFCQTQNYYWKCLAKSQSSQVAWVECSAPDIWPRPVFLPLFPALPRCLSPSSACWRTTTLIAASSALCCPWVPLLTWTAPPSTKPWPPYSSHKSTTTSWTLARSSPSGQSTSRLCFQADTRQHWWRQQHGIFRAVTNLSQILHMRWWRGITPQGITPIVYKLKVQCVKFGLKKHG